MMCRGHQGDGGWSALTVALTTTASSDVWLDREIGDGFGLSLSSEMSFQVNLNFSLLRVHKILWETFVCLIKFCESRNILTDCVKNFRTTVKNICAKFKSISMCYALHKMVLFLLEAMLKNFHKQDRWLDHTLNCNSFKVWTVVDNGGKYYRDINLQADGPGSGDCSEDTGHSGQLDNDEK